MHRIVAYLIPLCAWVVTCNTAVGKQVGCFQDVRYLGYCDLNEYHDDYLCVIRSRLQNGLTVSTLTISKIFKDSTQRKLVYSTPNTIKTVLTFEGNRIVTIWETGSSINLVVFASIGDSVCKVFDKGTENQPEFADINNDGSTEMLISRGRLLMSGGKVIRTPEMTEIYQWTGEAYLLLKEVPWTIRFCPE